MNALSKGLSEKNTANSLKKYVCIEIGRTAYTEYKMLSGEFETTEDGIFLGTVFAKDKFEAFEQLKNIREYERREFDTIIFYEVL